MVREAEGQLTDFAGNVISTTVVGACILGALVVGKKLLEGSDHRTYSQNPADAKNTDSPMATDNDVMEVDTPADDVTSHVSGEDKLE